MVYGDAADAHGRALSLAVLEEIGFRMVDGDRHAFADSLVDDFIVRTEAGEGDWHLAEA